VFVPPAGAQPSKWENVIAKLKASVDPNGFEWLVHSPNVSRSIVEAALDLKARIDHQWTYGGAYAQVVLIGLSLGGFIIRLAYLQSLGMYPDTPRTVDWA
jgi:hypothetical protein